METLDCAAPTRRSPPTWIVLSPALICLLLVLTPHLYFGVRWIAGTSWPQAIQSDPTIDGIPGLIQLSWPLGVLGSIIVVLGMAAQALVGVVRWWQLSVAVGIAAAAWLWVIVDPGSLFFYLSD